MFSNFIPLQGRAKDITGKQFGRLTALGPIGKHPKHGYKWVCVCTCGNHAEVRIKHLIGGNTHSCGCIKHGMTKFPEYRAWIDMRSRCNNPSHVSFHLWGGRGIKVCGRWDRFPVFLKDMGERPSNKYSIDRINNDGDYRPENCRWATDYEQMRNMRKNRLLTLDDRTMCASEWAEHLNVNVSTIFGRLNRGWSDVQTLTRPFK